MIKVGVFVNPDAGLGGPLALKGSDGQSKFARSAGIEDRAGPRLERSARHLQSLDGTNNIRWLLAAGRMGVDWWPLEFASYIEIGPVPAHTTASDTKRIVGLFLEKEVDLILYGGGDGTTRDILEALQIAGRQDLPIIGIPCGVKMYSGCFASSPEAATEALVAFTLGQLHSAPMEVLDLDEASLRQGNWKVAMHGEAMTPSSPRWIQGSKQLVESSGDDEVLEGMAEHISDLIEKEPKTLYLWGSGSTLHRISSKMGIETTLLGIDATIGRSPLHLDANAAVLESTVRSFSSICLLLSPMGGQGFLIGRGNLQLSPSVISEIGIGRILAIATPAKTSSIRAIRIETGDLILDSKFSKSKWIEVLVGYHSTRLMPIEIG